MSTLTLTPRSIPVSQRFSLLRALRLGLAFLWSLLRRSSSRPLPADDVSTDDVSIDKGVSGTVIDDDPKPYTGLR